MLSVKILKRGKMVQKTHSGNVLLYHFCTVFLDKLPRGRSPLKDTGKSRNFSHLADPPYPPPVWAPLFFFENMEILG